MAKVCPEMRAVLEADGRWSEFVKVREARIVGGLTPVEAFNAAIAEVCPEFAEEGAGKKRGRKPKGGRGARKSGRSEEGDRADALERIVAAKAKIEEMDAASAKRRKDGRPGLVAVGVFAGKEKVSASEEVLWVAKNLNMDVGVEDAPGELAWNFLMMCRENAEFKAKFMLNIASDVVKKRTEEDGGGKDKFDGSEEFDLLGEFAAKLRDVGGLEGGG